jgi:putative redox protein
MSEAHNESKAGVARLVARASGNVNLADAKYRATLRAGHHDLIADEGLHEGGADAGPTPFGYLLAGLAACTTITLRMYAERKNWPLTAVSVELEYYRDDAAFRIERVLHIEGTLDAEQRARMADIAERTPVTLALKTGNTINTKLANG